MHERFVIRGKTNMNILKFNETFPDESSCRNHFKTEREKHGVLCKKCSCKDHYWLKNKWQWQCKQCSFRTTLRSGTIMENSNLPFLMWYKCFALMTMSKKGISAMEMQRQLGHKRYDTVWLLMHKIRSVMGCRDDMYKLEGMVELDEGYFTKSIRRGSKPKRGRGSQTKQNVAVIAESTQLENIHSGEKSKQCRYFKMRVLDNHTAKDIEQVVINDIKSQSIILSDKSTSYVNLSNHVEVHIQQRSDKETTVELLKWVHIAISNAKRWILGIHHMVKGKYLQNYLNEFCYKLNRRYFGNQLFNRAIIAAAKSYW